MKTDPIGVFDSGIGGVAIFNAISNELPNENLIYLADRVNCPYGTKSRNEIEQMTKKIIAYFIKHYHIKCAVIACNTATVTSIKFLRAEYPDILIVGVVPVIKPASLFSKNKKIACLATYNTVNSDAQADLIKNFASDIEVYNVVCHEWVELVEEGLVDAKKTGVAIRKYIDPLVEKGVDVFALGCTHYTFLKDQIQKLIPKGILVMDSNEPVSKQVRRVLTKNNLLVENQVPYYRYLVNGDVNQFIQIVKPFGNGHFTKAEQIMLY